VIAQLVSEMSETRPVIRGVRGCIASSHYLATEAGFQILSNGGTAIDAAVAAGLALHVVEPHMNSIGGECPILVYSARDKRTYAISGQGTAPRRATLEFFERNNIKLIPGDGFLPAMVPSSFDSWITCLSKFGTMSLREVLEPAIRYAQNGIVIYPHLHDNIQQYANRFSAEWQSTAKIFLRNGKAPAVGEVLQQSDLARTLRSLAETDSLEAARQYFYSGPISRRIVEFTESHPIRDSTGKPHTGLIETQDFSQYRTRVEETVTTDWKGFTVHKCGTWSQGPVFLQQLRLLAAFNLTEIDHNSVDYIHLITEAAKLAFADREAFYGDPLFTKIPLDRLLSREYADDRRSLINMRKASMKLRPGEGFIPLETRGRPTNLGDTSHVDAADAKGNVISATPSGGWIHSSPVIEGLGFPLGTRGEMFSLQKGHPNCIAPGKRPRTTLSPSLVTSNHNPVLAFGTPGGDQQDQWTLQFFLNVAEFGMNLQSAIDAATFHTTHFPSSFYPRRAHLGELHLEDRIPRKIISALRKRGHKVVIEDGWSNGKVTAVSFDPSRNVVNAAASSRIQSAYALGY
jgi:gamma-glutamyltranspeptidase/glutathione hydrolase